MNNFLTTLRQIYKWGALFLCLAFFIMPLASCTYVNETATGWNIARGTRNAMLLLSSNPIMFIMLAIPIFMAASGFVACSFIVLRKAALLGLASHLIFIGWLATRSEFRNGLFEFAYGTWLVLLVYVLLFGAAHFGAFLTKKYRENDITMIFKL